MCLDVELNETWGGEHTIRYTEDIYYRIVHLNPNLYTFIDNVAPINTIKTVFF